MNRKGISVVIGYVLLVVIAISLSLLVYAWLKDLLPGNIENCPDEAALIITDYKCENKEIKLTLRNQGLFNLYGFIARINNVSDGFFYNLKHDSDIEHFFTNDILKPNEKEDRDLNYSEHNNINEIMIEPFILDDRGIILCDNSIIKQKLEGCN
tara:strand:+ start:170 stop:631 length:462 start_codon:yes stop_codon:yes gene_type:complete